MPKRPGSPIESNAPAKITRFFQSKSSVSEQRVQKSAASALTSVESKPVTVTNTGKSEDADGPPTTTGEITNEMSTMELSEEDKIENLLNLSNLQSQDEIKARFEKVATALFSQYRLRVSRSKENPRRKKATEVVQAEQEQTSAGANEEEETEEVLEHTDLQIMEMEFYLISPDIHEDPFCHGSMEQVRYFHRAPKFNNPGEIGAAVGGAYRVGSRKGVDLTLGGPVIPPGSESASSPSKSGPPIRGGILLRSIRVVKTGVIISGPSLLVDFILTTAGADDLNTLVDEHWKGDIFALSPSNNSDTPTTKGGRLSRLSLIPLAQSNSSKKVQQRLGEPVRAVPKIYRTPRIGLDLGHYMSKPVKENLRVSFVSRPYRYLIEPHLLKVNGRAQTFAGMLKATMREFGLRTVPLGASDTAKVLKKIEKEGGYTTKTARSYLDYYTTGVQSGWSRLGTFCGANGKGVCQSPEKVLQMFGILSELDA
ncbi:9897_t:CDS:2 [Acaulospora colombiana]|uniref:9897_t:CDS:1 n=1 Tax=Acaulospora colombiana TaxID=27376 RepID=A0ACA9MC01_9GLOM|nr:9897_t:CDS:2 [Acaulospora colombiana]